MAKQRTAARTEAAKKAAATRAANKAKAEQNGQPEVQAPKDRSLYTFASLVTDEFILQVVLIGLDENGKKLGKFPLTVSRLEGEDVIEYLSNLPAELANPETQEQIRRSLLQQVAT